MSSQSEHSEAGSLPVPPKDNVPVPSDKDPGESSVVEIATESKAKDVPLEIGSSSNSNDSDDRLSESPREQKPTQDIRKQEGSVIGDGRTGGGGGNDDDRHPGGEDDGHVPGDDGHLPGLNDDGHHPHSDGSHPPGDDHRSQTADGDGSATSAKEMSRRASLDKEPRPTGSVSTSSRKSSMSSELQLHLERVQSAETERTCEARKRREEEVTRLRKKMDEERRKKGIQMHDGSRESRKMIKDFLAEERSMAMEARQKQLSEETSNMESEIEEKYGFVAQKESCPGLVPLVATFYGSNEMPNEVLPVHIRRTLTTEEIKDLKLVFDMFDAKGRGYIISYDLKRAAGMLGFTATKHVFKEMIDELATDHPGKVTFINFLDFIIKSQGEGQDPYDDIMKGFSILDADDKGFLTYSDLRSASDLSGSSISNRALREMMHEADLTGSGQISPAEFVRIMMQTNSFRLTKRKARLK